MPRQRHKQPPTGGNENGSSPAAVHASPRRSTRITRSSNNEPSVASPHSPAADPTEDRSTPQGRRRNPFQDDLDSLHKEMEIVGYARGKEGQLRRKLPRKESHIRTRKRKLLELQDDDELRARNAEFGKEKRTILRGSMPAAEREVIDGSLVFPARLLKWSDDGKDSLGKTDGAEDDENAAVSDGSSEPDGDDNSNEGEEDTAGIVDEEYSVHEAGKPSAPSKTKRWGPAKQVSARKRRLYHARRFSSQKLAQIHGEALAAHAQGQHKVAIEKLTEVARSVPSAPQIYSSLGRVYEDMLNVTRERALGDDGQDLPQSDFAASEINTEGGEDEGLADHQLKEQLELSKKAYGAYHIAAVLCRKDYLLWVRAADMGTDIASIHERAAKLPDTSDNIRRYHRQEMKRWQSESLRDLVKAASEKPQGIDVPAKLAAAHLELGKLSEALTILTDLKNQGGMRGMRNEFQSSFKAWLLYADLMLRIGHECIQWNRGNKTNDNYMFRRWLRKWSSSYDWQERRLQALALALETSAGSENTEPFMGWMLQRAASKSSEGVGPIRKTSVDFSTSHRSVEVGSNGDGEEVDSSAAAPNESHFDKEKALLLSKHELELASFDRTTEDIDLEPGSQVEKNRRLGRKNMLQSHVGAVMALEHEYKLGDNVAAQKYIDNGERIMCVFDEPQPMTGSVARVCAIASELMKHLLGLELYEGVKHVGESVSRYMKARTVAHRKRLTRKQQLDEWQENVSKSVFANPFYDISPQGEDDSSNAGIDTYFSDEDDLIGEGEGELLSSLRKGVLPPELRVLFGFALLALGGRNFVAAKYIEAIDDLEQESNVWEVSESGTGISQGEVLWNSFRKAMVDPLGRTSAYAFLADVLRKSGRTEEWAILLSPMYRRHINGLKSTGLDEDLVRFRDDDHPHISFRKNQLLKVISVAIHFEVDLAVLPTQKHPVNQREVSHTASEKVKAAIFALESLAKVLQFQWKVESDGSVSHLSVEILKLCSRCMVWFSDIGSEECSYSKLVAAVGYTKKIVSIMCRSSFCEAGIGDEPEQPITDIDWHGFPIPSSWCLNGLRSLSTKSHNLVVACNVALFSGWEHAEFTLKLLRRRHGNRQFGIQIHGRRCTGILPTTTEERLVRQWEDVSEVVPSFPRMDAQRRLERVKRSQWYKTEAHGRDGTMEEVAKFGENHGLDVFLAFSQMCLLLARASTDKIFQDPLLRAALGVLIPISQFGFDDDLWDSDIGEAATSVSEFEEWKQKGGLTSRNAGTVETINKDSSGRRRTRKKDKRIEKRAEEWFRDADDKGILNYVKLPTRELRRGWFSQAVVTPNAEDRIKGNAAMSRVHQATSTLRACYTEKAAEKASLNVSKALLEMASEPACFDPFLCLQQAALFASQASKGGSSDSMFRHPLPSLLECTPMEALIILGRADCLQSVFFPNEAAYLCSFVAKVCRQHRGEEESIDPWKVVAVYAYNVSVMIRSAVQISLNREQQKQVQGLWNREVIEELERGRTVGLSWMRRMLKEVAHSGIVDEMDTNDEEDNELSENSDNEEEGEEEAKHLAGNGVLHSEIGTQVGLLEVSESVPLGQHVPKNEVVMSDEQGSDSEEDIEMVAV